MADVIVELEERYDFVLIDTAPIGVVSDSFPLVRQVDGVVVIVGMSKTTRDSTVDLRQQLERLNAPSLGVVANGARTSRAGQYGYGYYGQRSDTPTKSPAASGIRQA